MKIATISSAALTNAANHLRLVGDHDAAEALYALTDGHDALVIEGGEPLPRPIRMIDLQRAGQLTTELGRARERLRSYAAIPADMNVEIEMVVYLPSPPTTRLLGLDVKSKHEIVGLLDVAGEILKARVAVLESELRELGVDPSEDAAQAA